MIKENGITDKGRWNNYYILSVVRNPLLLLPIQVEEDTRDIIFGSCNLSSNNEITGSFGIESLKILRFIRNFHDHYHYFFGKMKKIANYYGFQ